MAKLREIDYIKTWGACVACATVGGFIAGAAAGMVVGIAITALHARTTT